MNLYRPRTRRMLLPALLIAVMGFAADAAAQGYSCVPSQPGCSRGIRQRAGSPCQCADNPAMMGEVVINGDVSPNYPGYRDGEGRSRGLRNDDLDDHDDVLAGPRHHHRRRPEAPARDDD